MGGWFGDCGGGVAGGLSGFKREGGKSTKELGTSSWFEIGAGRTTLTYLVSVVTANGIYGDC
jgi:hypothetical protein